MNFFKDIRVKLKLSQKELSELLCIKQCTLSNYETGKRDPSLRICYKLIKLAKLKNLKISMEEIRPE